MRNLLIFGAFLSTLAFGAGPQGAPTGKVVQIVGGAKAAERSLTYGDLVYAGEVIRTDNGSRVKILMTDRSIIDIGEDSAIRIRTYSGPATAEANRELDLELGSIRASVRKSPSGKGKFFIRTKSSVLAVRGTEFGATQDESGNLKVSVFEGVVRIGDKYDLTAGQDFHQMAGNNVPEMRRLSVKEFSETRNRYTTDSTGGGGDAATSLIAGDHASDRNVASFDRIANDPRQYAYNNNPGQPNGLGEIDKGNRGSNGIPVAVLIIYDQTPAVRR